MALNIEKRLQALEEKYKPVESKTFLIIEDLCDLTEEQKRTCPKYRAAMDDWQHRLHLVVYDCPRCDWEGPCSVRSELPEEGGPQRSAPLRMYTEEHGEAS